MDGRSFRLDTTLNAFRYNKTSNMTQQTTSEILSQRGSRYGSFMGQAGISQALEDVMRNTGNWTKLAPDQKEALKLIQHKIARILNGDPNYDDSWVDIEGYAKLISNRLRGIKSE